MADVKQLPHYSDIINYDIDNLSRLGLLDDHGIRKLKNAFLAQCTKNNWHSLPSEKCPVKSQDERNVTKLLCECFLELGEKAPNIQEFPGDFSDSPDCLGDIEINFSTNYSECLSTGYYLPAGVKMSIYVSNGDCKGWRVRIGAHTDVLNNSDHFCR